jgi:pteridine reductase
MGSESSGRVALVTGGGRRVGQAIALEVARAGYDVALHYRHAEEGARQTAGEVEAIGRRTVLIQADLTAESAPEAVVDQAVQSLGGLNALINSASVYEPSPLGEMSRESWRSHLDLNLMIPALLAQAAWPHLRQKPTGHIVNICDIAGDRPWSSYLAYCASKSGLINLTKALAKAMAPEVFVNGISPGVVQLPEGCDEQTRRSALSRVPLGREGRPEDVAYLVRFFVEKNTYILGQVIAVDGGRSIA